MVRGVVTVLRGGLRAIEGVNPTTGIGLYFTVLWALGLEQALVNLIDASRDRGGLTLDAARSPERVRAPHSGPGDDFQAPTPLGEGPKA